MTHRSNADQTIDLISVCEDGQIDKPPETDEGRGELVKSVFKDLAAKGV